MAVDWEQRIDFARLRERAAREGAGGAARLGRRARCCSSIRTTSATSRAPTSASGRATRARAACCCRARASPVLWDFGSAAKHHQLYAPWLPESSWRAGVTSMRGAMPRETGVPDALAAHIYAELTERGLAERAARDRPDRHGDARTRSSATASRSSTRSR